MQLRENTVLQGGKYRIKRFISSGGFGCTYEAECVNSGKRVAIKEFFVKDFCNRDENTQHVTVGTQSKKGLVDKLQKKFIDEARVLQEMRHPNIVSVSEVFEENGTAYFVMDYIDGLSLHEIVRNEGALGEKRAVKYIRQAAEALQYVHNLNRLHLDIKPHNIMVNGNDQAILIDFGASKQYDEMNGENTSTLIGQTPGYAPLEQIGNDVVRFFPATDIYSLGATLYKLLSGDTPLSASLLASGEELKPLSVNITERTRTAVTAAMTVNKSKRPQTIADFLILLGEEEKSPESVIGVENTKSESRLSESEETMVLGGTASKTSEPRVESVDSPSSKSEPNKSGKIVATL
jgi:serine/threonine protein kinase